MAPKVRDDSGSKRSAIILPTPSPPKVFRSLKNLKMSCSFMGNNCTCCNFLGGNHSIKNCQVFFLGDTFFPAMIGGAGECAPNIRVEQGDFNQLRDVLLAQKANGFSPKAGSFAMVGLLAHLLRVGAENYLAQLVDFSNWLNTHFNLRTFPILFPFQLGFTDVQLVIIRQFFTLWQGKHMGDFLGNHDSTFQFWVPLFDTLQTLKIDRKPLPVPPVTITSGSPRVIECIQDNWVGYTAGSSKRIPQQIESLFLLAVFSSLKLISSPSTPLKLPSDASLNIGFSRGAPNSLGVDKPTIFLFGTSILGRVSEPLTEITHNLGVNVVSSCKGGDFTVNWKGMKIPISSNKNDICVLHFMANNMFKHKGVHIVNNTFHLNLPTFLIDSDIDSLISETTIIIEKIKLNFMGKIKLICPFPRFLKPCCNDPRHALPPSPPFQDSISYTLALNQFLVKHPSLCRVANLEVIPFTSVFGNLLPSDFTSSDNVHLSHSTNKKFAAFLSTLAIRQPVRSTPFNQSKPSFYTWADTIMSCANQHTQVKSSPTAPTEPFVVATTLREMETDEIFEPELNLDSAMRALNMEVTLESIDNFHSAFTKA